MKLAAVIEHAENLLLQQEAAAAWEALEDLPTEAKNHPHVLELRLECLVSLKAWDKAEILGESLVLIWPDNPVLWLDLARARAQMGKHEQAREAMHRVSRLAPERRLAMLSDPLLEAAF